MLYSIAHFFRDRLPFIWDIVDIINSWLFWLRYGSKLKSIEKEVLLRYEKESGLKIVPLSEVSADSLSAFFAAQPEDAFAFFKPHGFDAKSIKKLQRNKSFLGYILIDDNHLTGSGQAHDDNSKITGNIRTSETSRFAAYCFIRSFFIGKGFRGRMVGIDHRGRGIGTQMNRLLNDVGFSLGLRIFETVNKENIASYRSALSASNVRVLEEMEGNDLYLEILNESK